MSLYSNMQLAEIFIKTGELDDALEALNSQLKDDGSDDNARRLRASVLLRLGQPDNLQTAIEDIDTLQEKTLDDYVQQSVIYERMNQAESAINAMENAVKLAPDNERNFERLIELLTQEKRYTTALSHLSSAPKTWRWLMRQADLYVLDNQHQQALEALNQAATHLQDVFPDLIAPVSRNTMAQIHIARGHVYMTQEQFAPAETDFKDALYYIPDDASIEFNLGLVYALTDRLELAIKTCQSALDKTTPYIRETLVNVLKNDERYTDLKEKLVIT